MKPKRSYIHFLEDMLLALERIQEYIKDYDFISFKQDYKTVDAVVRNFEIIGEAAKNLPVEVKEKYNQLPWEEMYRMRNKISHEYFGINYEILWQIATNEVPENYKELVNIFDIEKGTNT